MPSGAELAVLFGLMHEVVWDYREAQRGFQKDKHGVTAFPEEENNALIGQLKYIDWCFSE